MGSYKYRKVDIEGVGCFTVPEPIWDLLQDIDTIRDAAIAERDAARAEANALRDELATLRLTAQGSRQEHSCAVCGREDGISMNTVTLCDHCYEDRIA